ncbi:hypothetical protein NEILACOT_04369 [Neisseria lactamica ATCC 23970]|uniref:Uncharacterized protein n=1 Tax=Neisseria lactamica ATCC 23970 TaxID=546265 RepID=D0WA04_NEILA|nr:hypothetical protein NEILACOT_04369 [Neisseria lactamica ATCC 23970]
MRETADFKGKAADNQAAEHETRNAKDNRRSRNRQNERNAAAEAGNPEVRTLAAATPSENEARPAVQAQEGKRRRNNNRNERNREQAENRAEETLSEAAGNVAEEGVQTAGADAPKGNERRQRERNNQRDRRERNNQRDRRQNGKKRNIPSAAKIEQYLNIHDTADKVRSAAAHVFGENDANAPITVSIAGPVAERDVPTASPAVSNGDAPVYDAAEKIRQAVAAILPEGTAPEAAAQEMPSETATFTAAVKQARETVQTGGLVLIETDPAALKAWAAQPEVQTGRGIRRSEQPKPSEAATVPAEEMIQVETRQG